MSAQQVIPKVTPFSNSVSARRWAEYKYPMHRGRGTMQVKRLNFGMIDCEPGWYLVDKVTGKIIGAD